MKKEYTRAYAGFGGMDVTSDDSNVAATRFPYIINMWRDFRSENGAAVETFPGWRLLPWDTGAGATINGLYGAKFLDENGATEDFLIIHKGENVYAEKIGNRDEKRTLTAIGKCADTKTTGFQHREAFYLMDGSTIHRIGYDGRSFIMSEVGMEAYIPTTYADGYEYEQRNMLTNEFYTRYNIQKPEETKLPDDYLTYAVIDEALRTAKVTGIEKSREIKNLYIPSTVIIDRKTYHVTTIADKAFQNKDSIETVVIPSSVAYIGETVNDAGYNGAFYSCQNLRRVVIHGAKTIAERTFEGCAKLDEIFISGKLENGSLAVPAQATTFAFPPTTIGGMLYVYYEGSQEQAAEVGITAWNGGSVVVKEGVKLFEANVGDTINAPYSTGGGTPSISLSEMIPGNNLSSAYSYQLKATQQGGLSVDITIKERVGLLWLTVKGSDPLAHIIITAKDDVGVFNPEEGELFNYRFELYEPTKTIRSVTLDNENVLYNLFTEELDGKTYVRSVVLTAEKNSLNGRLLIIHGEAWESEFSRSKAGEDYKYGNASYKGTSAEAIKKCTLYAEYDGRIFLSGNPNLPNTVFYSNRNLSGVNDPTYFGQLNYFNDGQGMIPNASLLATPSFLAVIKRDISGEGTVYYHTAETTEYDVLPKIYPCVQGAANVGSIGPATNFRDDPVFLSKDGLEGISLSAVNNERGIYHRSTTADKWLLAELSSGEAVIAEWEGYLCILVNGKLFLADSRQISKINGSAQYEWYFIDDVAYYEGQRLLYYFPSSSPYDSQGNKLTEMYINGIQLEVKESEGEYRGYPEKEKPTLDAEGATASPDTVYYVKEEDADGAMHYFIVDSFGEMIDGERAAATTLCSANDLLFIGTESGRLVCVNTDKRGEAYGEDEVARDRIHPEWYTRCNRRYISGFATKKDDCGVPNFDKDTVKRSLVVKVKMSHGSKLALTVRTDRESWKAIQENTASLADAYDVDYSNASFITTNETIRQLKEDTRRWVEKQYYVYSDEYKRPFGIYSMAFRYVISGLNGRIRRG